MAKVIPAKNAPQYNCPMKRGMGCDGPNCMLWRASVPRRIVRMPLTMIPLENKPEGPPENWPREYVGEWSYDEEIGTWCYVETERSAEDRSYGSCGLAPYPPSSSGD